MSEALQHKRHTLAHLLAAAVMELYPDAKRAIGPAIDNGFYYDFEFSSPLSDEDLSKIQKTMRKMLNKWVEFERKEISAEEARELYKDNPYKLELIEEHAQEGLTFYTCGGFTDLCRGGHAEHPSKEIDSDAFKLSHLAGAYWRGDEKNKMLTRIYGLAFDTKEELDHYLAMIEEAKKRDHKILGPKLDLFVFSDLVGGGLPLWTPNGCILRHELKGFVSKLRKDRGYVDVEIPHITKRALYETSGHWDKYADDLFKITTREGHEYAMKPMNCPHHTQIYARKPWSYRELPQRYMNTTMVYRDEQSGELAGLARVLAITQDDAHVFCRMSQFKDEALKIWDIIHEFYGAFGIPLQVRLSTRDPKAPEKYLGDSANWDVAEGALREIIKEKNVTPLDGTGEAAFYGPKLDFMGRDAIGREHQVATIQLDMNMPERFDLTCVNEKGEKERIVMVHAAIMGSIERFMALAIEHFAGAFPLWLSPVQIAVLPISEKHNEEAGKVTEYLKGLGLRAELHNENESIGKKIRNAEMMKIPYLFVMGDKEIEAKKIALRQRGKGDLGIQDSMEVIARIQEEIKTKAL